MKQERTSQPDEKVIFPLTDIDRDYRKFKKAGYIVEKRESINEGSMYLQVFDPNVDVSKGILRRMEYEYDGTGNIFKSMAAFDTPIELNTDNDKKVF